MTRIDHIFGQFSGSVQKAETASTYSAETKEMFEKEYIAKDFEPLRCPDCEGTEVEEIVTDRMEGGVVCEKDVVCKSCGRLLGQWSYGNWIP